MLTGGLGPRSASYPVSRIREPAPVPMDGGRVQQVHCKTGDKSTSDRWGRLPQSPRSGPAQPHWSALSPHTPAPCLRALSDSPCPSRLSSRSRSSPEPSPTTSATARPPKLLPEHMLPECQAARSVQQQWGGWDGLRSPGGLGHRPGSATEELCVPEQVPSPP